jgi:hypothetical protein
MSDLRYPIGFFFAIIGVILEIAALVTPDGRAPLASERVNLYCGLAMLMFGGVMLWLARRAS